MSIEDDIRYEPTIDDLFEAKLRKCRKEGHDLYAGTYADGSETLTCARCDTRFVEEVA